MIPYFGLLPPIYKIWEVTALANSTIDFYVFTDDISAESKRNITVIQSSFDEFKTKLQQQFSFTIACKAPYKLCDYKPLYGVAFKELFEDYEWWGYCDIDLLLGDLRKFFTDECLNNCDRCQLLGHLCIYRNCDRINTLWRIREDNPVALNYDSVYQTEEAMYFDEARGLYTKGLLSSVNVYKGEFRDPEEGERKFI